MSDRYYIECGDKYFKRGKTFRDHKWVRTKRAASRFCKKAANRYVREWKQDGAKKVRAGQKRK